MLDTHMRYGHTSAVLTQKQIDRLRRTKTDARNRVGVAMELAEVTQVQVAEATGFTQSYVSRIKSGQHEALPVDTARKFAEFFGCSIEDLFPAREAVAS